MKINRSAKLAFVAIAAIALAPFVSSAQTASKQTQDSVVAVVADAQGLQRVPYEQLPFFGTFWEVRNTVPCVLAPLPGPPWDTSSPIYAIADGQFLIDETAGPMMVSQKKLSTTTYASVVQEQVDELVNFITWIQQVQANKESSLTMNTMDSGGPPSPGEGGGSGTNDWGGYGPLGLTYTTNDLWLELITKTNATGYFVLHPPWTELTNGVYDIFETTNLSVTVPGLNGTNWLWIYRTTPGQTNFLIFDLTDSIAFFRAAKTNDTDGDGMSDAFERLSSHTDPNTPDGPSIVFQPLSQTVEQGDTVTFSVIAQGPSPLRYQWMFGGTNISGATNSSFTVPVVQSSDAGDYSVEVISPALLSVVSSNATLAVQAPANWPLVTLAGPRQDYVFRNGVSYYVPTRVELYGTTVIEGGATIKVDWYYTDSTLAVMGTLVCKTDDPYFPAFLTSVDDDTVGDAFQDSSGTPVAISNGVPYLDLTYAEDTTPTLNNLRIRYADQGVATPAAKRLNVWNCQFNKCNSSIIAKQGSTVSLHNVLFGTCGAAVTGFTNFTAIEAEHVTADATNFWSQLSPTRINLTNCIVVGTIASGPTLVTDHSAINPASPFQPAGSGHYYLASGSSYRKAGTANISSRLATEFRQKTTQPPVILPDMIKMVGELTFGQQVARYTNGAPDYGYYYAALDYTVGWITNWGSITVLPGTAIGFRNEYSPEHNRYTWWGFDLREGSSFTSQGTPSKPNIFADVQLIQEQLAGACIAFFVPDYWPFGGPNFNAAPTMDFRFCKFYANSKWYHVWSGYDTSYQYLYSPDSRVDWTMRDCSLYGGRITLGKPDDGSVYGAPPDWVYGPCAVSWINNLFDGVAVDLDPTFYELGYGLNCDMAFSAYNNLVRQGLWFHIQPIPATAGDWVFKDNLFDKVDFVQDTNAPLAFNYNGYWRLSSAELGWLYNYYPWFQPNAGQFLTTTNGGGGNEQVLSAALPYQSGPLGGFYLPTTTALYHAGSRTADAAGMHQYTTRTDQIKEGDEFPSGHNVNIGLHYVATTNASGTIPKDSDGDGVPDYVEDGNGNGTVDDYETSPSNTMTDGVTADAYNSVYDAVDLSGSGLTGLAKKTLGVNPLDPNSPLKLTQVTTGDEPITFTFDVPVSYDTVTAAGFFRLNLDGYGATGEQLARATNGHCLLIFNQYYDSPGQHLLSATLQMGDHAASGPVFPFFSNNELQFEPAGAMFDDYSAYLDAKVFTNQVDYVINLYDTSTTNETYILSITNTTYNGLIQEDWGVTNANGTPFTGTSIRAEFDVARAGTMGPMGAGAGGGANKPSKPLQRATNSLSEWGLNFNVAYFYTPTNGVLSTAFAKGGDVWNGMQGVVDYLIAPRYGFDHYNSAFNRFLPDQNGEYPGYLTSRAMVTNNLYPTLLSTKQFFCYAHGNSNWMGNAASDTFITAGEIGGILQNSRSNNVIIGNNPYRFVFLDGCSTASGLNWQTAFGIADKTEFTRTKTGPQAYVGWAKPVADWMGGNNDPILSAKIAKAYTKTLQLFYLRWMTGVPLAATIDQASLSLNDTVPLPVPENKNCLIIFTDGNTYQASNAPVARLIIAGRPGLRVDGLDPANDARKDYAR